MNMSDVRKAIGCMKRAAKWACCTWLPPVVAAQLALTAAPPANADIYGHWPLNDGQGDIAMDHGPRMENGTIFSFDTDGLGPGGSVWVDDPERGTVLGLGGNTAWVSAGTIPVMDLANDFSWAFWARQPPGQASPANDIILGNRYDTSGTNVDTVPREFIKFTPNRFEYHFNGGGRNDLQYASPESLGYIPSNDQWIHHSVVKDGNTLMYYRNGVLSNTDSLTEAQMSAFPLPFALGGQHGVETWRGYLSDVQLYATALTQDDIQNTVMTGSEVANADLYARYKLDDGTGDMVAGTGTNPGLGIIVNPDDGLGPGGSVWVDDPERGTVLGLGGNTAWVDATELPEMTLDQDFTWNFWARQDPGQASPANDIIIGSRYDIAGQGVDTVPPEWIKFTPNRFEFHLNNSGSGDINYAAGQLGIPSNDQWIHHVVVKDGDQLSYYRNGELANSSTILDPMFTTEPLAFGMGGQNGAETWQGYLSDVYLFDHSLSLAEIMELAGIDVGEGIMGDYNANGTVEQADLDLVLLNWGQSGVPAGWTNDLPDGNIDQAELDGVLLNWGNVAALGSAAGVPEPSTLLLMLVAAGLGIGLVRRE
jgi:hypothetical protein